MASDSASRADLVRSLEQTVVAGAGVLGLAAACASPAIRAGHLARSPRLAPDDDQQGSENVEEQDE
jgi:hypothetical protein